jgi:hypothetical protein
MCERNELPYALLEADPADAGAWTSAAGAAIERLLTARRPTAR